MTLGGEYMETLAEVRLGTVFPSFCKRGISHKPEELKQQIFFNVNVTKT